MKSIALLFGLSIAVNAYGATAYEALRIVGKEQGEALLDNVVEVRGTKGAPTPRTWRILVKEKGAEGGIREYEVQGTRIVGDRPLDGGGSGPVLNMNSLMLDSDGAHTVAEREAKKSSYSYDHVNYTLRGGAGAGKPVWEVRLVDERDGRTATLNVGADNGKMIASKGLKNSTPGAAIAEGGEKRRRGDVEEEISGDGEEIAPPPTERQIAETRRRREAARREEERRREEAEEREDTGRSTERPGARIGRFFERAGRHIGGAFQKAGNKIERAVTGNDRRTSTPPPPPRTTAPARRTTRDANGTEYYRPRD